VAYEDRVKDIRLPIYISEDAFTQEHGLIKVKRIATKKQKHMEIRSNNGYSRYKGSRKI
jgi:hypothetical protein